jgi:hypothetical protein
MYTCDVYIHDKGTYGYFPVKALKYREACSRSQYYCGFYTHTYVCMYVCMYVYTYVCMYVCMYACILQNSIFLHINMCICMHVRIYVCMYICIFLLRPSSPSSIRIWSCCMFVISTQLSISVYTYTYMYVCVHTCIRRRIRLYNSVSLSFCNTMFVYV